MVYIHAWQDYQDAAEALYAKSPNARYVVKYKHNEGQLVLKITDDKTCLKFKTHSSVFLNRFEALNLSLMRKMQNVKPPSVPTPSTAAGAPSTAAAVAKSSIEPTQDVEMREATPAPVQVTSGAAGGGGVKKKKGKKKK
ncbi:signal recognition particle, SRP9/SRP14 subunit [Schizophyllum amplum]|uniref:Signal recognition particle, SRP9/SRP14 subunit n=1 Tax=Schizophyllum amplum TaxID=97359 RepID=A0A550C0C8_9AGAR|nr:signal recognition particle, SRP9/SRP14 subunit [Auriculariopsis ampla]